MLLDEFLEKIKNQPQEIAFSDVLDLIEKNYNFTETAFKNGPHLNVAGQNSGSCKIFSFAKLHDLTAPQTLACFGHYYREDVLKHPQAKDHQNIRQFMISGWQGIDFSSQALYKK
ncbi:HopJ type III effector protein [Psychromonas ingrahamii]|uniref:HopJ type III effector protein n=1 Tax=Psychromonas ingrahamii TaxID=357794 RepID=UPI0000D80238|nr:HopJ type III effector protein [Psychromonas ingrahamii]